MSVLPPSPQKPDQRHQVSRRKWLIAIQTGWMPLLFSEQVHAGGQVEEPLMDSVRAALSAAIANKEVTYDLARLMDGATEVSCSAFGDAMIARM